MLTEGVSGQGYYFEGDGDCISIPDSPVFDFDAGDFTISAWFRTNVSKAPFPFLVNFRQNDNNPHIELYAGNDVGSHLLPGAVRVTYPEAGVNDDKWHHVAIALDNGAEDGYRLYVDGLKVADANYVGRLADWDSITIGAQRKGGDNQFAFEGFIDEVGIYNVALSGQEIRDIYRELKSGTEQKEGRQETEGVTDVGLRARLQALVEDFFKHNYRDITGRRTIEWGEPELDSKANMSIRYKYEATIRGKDKIITDQKFVFDKDGKVVSYEKISPYAAGSKEWAQELVEDFFKHNYRDITSRRGIEWGEPVREGDGNISIRYKYEATIWERESIVNDEVYTFTESGEFVSVKAGY